MALRRLPSALGLALAAVFGLVVLGLAVLPATPAVAQDAADVPLDPGLSRGVPLQPGWNLVGWSGGEAALAEVGLGAEISAAYAYQGGADRFLAFNAALPDDLNTLQALHAAEGLWLHVNGSQPALWTQPIASAAARSVPLHEGFNLVTWTGPNRMLARDALGALGDALQVAYTFESGRQAFLRWGADLPSRLRTLGEINYGDAVWLRMRNPTLWQQPSPLFFRCNPFPDYDAATGGDWMATDLGRVIVQVREGSTAARYLEPIQAAATEALTWVEGRLGLQADAPITIRVHSTPRNLRSETGGAFNAIAYPATSTLEIVCGIGDAGDIVSLRSLRHELTHIVSVRAKGDSPFFLEEGLAGYVEGSIGFDSLDAWARRAKTLDLPHVSEITTNAGYFETQPVVNAFVTSALLVRYLIDTRGLEPFWRLWRFAERDPSDAGPRAVYGKTWNELDAAYRAANGLPAVPPPDADDAEPPNPAADPPPTASPDEPPP